MDSKSSETGLLLPLPKAAALIFGGARDQNGCVRSSEASNMRLRRMVRDGEIKAVRLGKRIYIPRAVIDDLAG